MAQYLDTQGQQMPASDPESRVYRDERGQWWVRTGLRNHRVSVLPLSGGRWEVRVDGVSDHWQVRNLREVLMERMGIDEDIDTQALELRAPMPGKVVSFAVKSGDTVKAGQALAVMEAMKMEHTIAAPADGEVLELLFAPGDQVAEGDELLTLKV